MVHQLGIVQSSNGKNCMGKMHGERVVNWFKYTNKDFSPHGLFESELDKMYLLLPLLQQAP